MKEITAFTEANIPDFKNHIVPDKNGGKNKTEVMSALAKFVRVQQPDKHWIDADGKPAGVIIVPPAYVVAAASPAQPAESAAQPEVAPVSAEASAIPACPIEIPCISPAPEPAPEPVPAAPMEFTWVPELNAPGAYQ